MIETKTIKRFKNKMIASLPFFPNTKEVKQTLEHMHVRDVMLHYIHWRSRLLPSRPRKVQIASEVTSDTRWKKHRNSIYSLLQKSRDGADLTPYHSIKAHKEGYTPYTQNMGKALDSWKDKDFLLNAYGFYHLHLSQLIEKKGYSERSGDILFCYVNREMLRAIGIFNHDVFSNQEDGCGNITSERMRLLKLSDKYESMGRQPGSVYISNMITSSGHPIHLSMAANRYFNHIRQNDSYLNDREFVNTIYISAKLSPPAKYDLSWGFNDLDFGVFDQKNKIFIVIYKGHI